MQTEAPEAVDLGAEDRGDATALRPRRRRSPRPFGEKCLLARRLVERGVRFVQVYCGDGQQWDAHDDLEDNHGKRCRETDQPIAGLLTDLKRRGLLDETLVVWGGEFGRTPIVARRGDGRDHNPYGFTIWLAGGGVKGGHVHGATDEIGCTPSATRSTSTTSTPRSSTCSASTTTRLTYLHNGRGSA